MLEFLLFVSFRQQLAAQNTPLHLLYHIDEPAGVGKGTGSSKSSYRRLRTNRTWSPLISSPRPPAVPQSPERQLPPSACAEAAAHATAATSSKKVVLAPILTRRPSQRAAPLYSRMSVASFESAAESFGVAYESFPFDFFPAPAAGCYASRFWRMLVPADSARAPGGALGRYGARGPTALKRLSKPRKAATRRAEAGEAQRRAALRFPSPEGPRQASSSRHATGVARGRQLVARRDGEGQKSRLQRGAGSHVPSLPLARCVVQAP